MKKRRIHINAMDFVILAVIAAAVILLLYVFVFSDESEVPQDTFTEITYVVEVTGVEEQFENRIKDGQRVEDAVKRAYLGTVTGTPEVRDTLRAQFDNDSRTEVYSKIPGKCNLYITITAEAAVTNHGYLVGEQYIYVGELLSMVSPDMKCEGYCIRIDAAE